MKLQHEAAAEILRLLGIAWPDDAQWRRASADGLSAMLLDALKSMCEDFGEDFAEERRTVMVAIRERAWRDVTPEIVTVEIGLLPAGV